MSDSPCNQSIINKRLIPFPATIAAVIYLTQADAPAPPGAQYPVRKAVPGTAQFTMRMLRFASRFCARCNCATGIANPFMPIPGVLLVPAADVESYAVTTENQGITIWMRVVWFH